MHSQCRNLAGNHKDASSYSNPHEISISHIDLDLHVDFPTKSLKGHVDLTLKIHDPSCSKVILDVTTLKVHKITDAETGAELKYSFSERSEIFGYALTVNLAKNYTKDDSPKVRIAYETAPEASALQWLEPQQTMGKKYPFMFSQCEEIHCRSLVPVQDTPGSKLTLTAKISVEKPMRGLVGAVLVKEEQVDDRNVYYYEQKIPVPSYLISIAAGDIHYVDISDRIRVYCEEGNLEKSKYEFEPAEKMLKAAEDLLTPYEWSRYDMIVLPPSFPFGGMENPCLTFLSPTLLAGDQSLINVMIHEMTHSWIGNLVTNSNWSHFWLNEGINVYHERRVAAIIYGEKFFHLSAIEGLKALQNYVKLKGEQHPFTVLVTNLDNIDPDDAYSVLYYEKGFFLCLYLEQVFGLEFIQPFFRDYVNEFRLKSINSDDFHSFLEGRVKDKLGDAGLEKFNKIDWEGWFNKPGVLPQKPELDYTEYNQVSEIASLYYNNINSLDKLKDRKDFDGWHTMNSVLFFEEFEHKVEEGQTKVNEQFLDWMDSHYKLSDKNAEIATKWFALCIKSNYTKVDPKIRAFLTSVGRMKFVRPLFRALVDAGRTDFAKQIYQENKGSKHSLEIKLIGTMLGEKN